ncbi:MAG: DUF2877 domain-containing protein [Chloroflexi bacterium]|nr:MAG: DUF2877 domain-containing protein [Chloroflexota bacterium]
MYLRAISIGYAVPDGNFDAAVHSVFQSALNLRLNGENNLLTLLASGEGDLPQGMQLDTPEGFSFEEFQTGELAVCKEDILHFENSSLTVQLSGARRWKCDLPALEFDPRDPAVSAAWSFVWEALNERQRLSEAEIIVEELLRSNESARAGVPRKAGEAMRDLISAARRYDLDTSAVSALIGLGSGLTPSGDDLLVGYLAGRWCTVQGASERAQFIASLGETIIQLSSQTNDISRTYLYHAVQAQVSSRLANLAETICRGENPEPLSEIAEAAMRVGHTSGMDAVTGLLIGLVTWTRLEASYF